MTAYTMYFNKRHKRVGTLFQGVFKASRISSDSYLLHISRYTHLNPRTYKTYYYSSFADYLGRRQTAWPRSERVLCLIGEGEYAQFMEDYESRAELLQAIKTRITH